MVIVIAALLIATIFAGATTVSTGFAAIVERLGKYSQTLGPGFHVIIPFIDCVATKVPLRVQQHNITVTTKTKRIMCSAHWKSPSSSAWITSTLRIHIIV